MSKPAEVILLCEDALTSTLLRLFLKRCGIDYRNIRFVISPKGRGAGESFVVRHYPEQVEAYRLSKARKKTWLIVAVDADTGTVAARIHQLDSNLMQSEYSRLRQMAVQEEQIAHLIPRRNIETWFLVLTGATADEENDYKATRNREKWQELAAPASRQLYDWTRQNARLSAPCTDSLRIAIRALGSLLEAAE